jgi:hypothetical protein
MENLMSEYYYLVASLPMLSLEDLPEISSEEFLEVTMDHLPACEFAALRDLSLQPISSESQLDSIKAWSEWETSVRNTIVVMRAEGDASLVESFKRSGGGFFAEVEKGVSEAFSKSDPLEREKYLANMRWAFLDDLELGHEFDVVKLVVYRLKLLLCEKFAHVSKEKGVANYDTIIAGVYDKSAGDL